MMRMILSAAVLLATSACVTSPREPTGDSVIEPGDEVLVVLDVGIESRVTELFTARTAA